MKEIDLGRKDDMGPCCMPDTKAMDDGESKIYYPSVYVSKSDPSLKVGDEVLLKGTVVSTTESEKRDRDEECSCEIEVKTLQVKGDSKAKASRYDDDAVEKGLKDVENEQDEPSDDSDNEEEE